MAPAPIRVWLVGFGTVGRWIARALLDGREAIAARHGLEFEVVGIASRRDGFVYDPSGIDLGRALSLREAGEPLTRLGAAERFDDALAGLRATEADLLAETALSPPEDGQPGLAHMREALGRGIGVVCSNKWPVALAGVELAERARTRGAVFRAESTVMSGTPALAALTAGLGGARPGRVRGVVNATANFILSRVAAGEAYDDALAEAQRIGLAEPDPGTDVDGHDATAKAMILAALVFGVQLRAEQVRRRGISDLGAAEIDAARGSGLTLREVTTVESTASGLTARVEPVALDRDDPLASVDGTQNAIVCEVEPLGEISVAGPGAGVELAGQGVLADLIAAGGELARARVARR